MSAGHSAAGQNFAIRSVDQSKRHGRSVAGRNTAGPIVVMLPCWKIVGGCSGQLQSLYAQLLISVIHVNNVLFLDRTSSPRLLLYDKMFLPSRDEIRSTHKYT